jgi:hypothetical protein
MRHSFLVVFVGAAVVASACTTTARNAGGDPGGRIVRSLVPETRLALPPGAENVNVHLNEPTWESTGCDGIPGWTLASITISFTSGLSSAEIQQNADQSMSQAGWNRIPTPSYLGPAFAVWSNPAKEGTAAIHLFGNSAGEPSATWHLVGTQPAQGKAVQTC